MEQTQGPSSSRARCVLVQPEPPREFDGGPEQNNIWGAYTSSFSNNKIEKKVGSTPKR